MIFEGLAPITFMLSTLNRIAVLIIKMIKAINRKE